MSSKTESLENQRRSARLTPITDSNPTYITVLSTVNRRPVGKRFTLGKHGNITKATAAASGNFNAQRIELSGTTPLEILSSMSALLASLEPHQVIIAGHNPEMGDEPYQIITEKELENRIGDKVTNSRYDFTKPTCARLKRDFTPSRIALFDFDDDGDSHTACWSALGDAGRMELLQSACPEFAGAARLNVASSSNRVLLDGSPAASKGSSHTFLLFATAPTTADLDRFRRALTARLWAHNLGYTKTSASNATLRRAIYDTSVFSPERLIFSAPPTVAAPLTLAPFHAALHEGNCIQQLPVITTSERKKYQEKTGSIITRNFSEINGIDLSLDTELFTQENGAMSFKQFLASGIRKVRIQSPFRESSSFAAIAYNYGLGAQGVYDAGTGTKYVLNHSVAHLDALADDSEDEDTAPKKRKHQNTLKADLATISEFPSDSLAARTIRRQKWRMPQQYSVEGLVNLIMDAAPTSLDYYALTDYAQEISDQCRRSAIGAVDIYSDDDDAPYNVIFRHAATVLAVQEGIEQIANGFHVVKAPHGTGKTSVILKYFSQLYNRQAFIAPLRSLVADAARKLDLISYTNPAFTTNIAICLKSITNPTYSHCLDNADFVAVDEISRVIHDVFSLQSYLGNGKEYWQKLTQLFNSAAEVILVDADISAHDLQRIAATTTRTVHCWIVPQPEDCGRTYAIETEKNVVNGILETVRAGKNAVLVTDSAKKVEGITRALQSEFPEYAAEIIGIHADDTTGTTGSPEVIALLDDINNKIVQYKVAAMSPAVSSGVSIEAAHFDYCAAIYGGTILPSQMNQMLLRYRPGTHWNIAITGSQQRSLETSAGRFVDSLESAAKIIEPLGDGTYRLAPADDFDKQVCLHRAQQNRHLNSYGSELCYVLEHRGWKRTASKLANVEKCPIDTREHASQSASRALKSAKVVTAEDVKRIKSATSANPAELAAVQVFHLRRTLGIADDAPITDEHVDSWDDGEMRQRVQYFESLTTDINRLSYNDRDDAHLKTPLSSCHFDAPRRIAARALFCALGFSPVNGEGRINWQTVLDSLDSFKSTDEAKTLLLNGHRFNVKKQGAIKWVRATLKAYGLALGAKRDDRKGGFFELDRSSWDDMVRIAERRAADALARRYPDEFSGTLPPR